MFRTLSSPTADDSGTIVPEDEFTSEPRLRVVSVDLHYQATVFSTSNQLIRSSSLRPIGGYMMKFGYMLFYVSDVEKTIEFFEGAFGLTRKFYTLEDGQAYGELDTGDTTIGFVSYSLAKAQGIEITKPNSNKPPPACDIGFVTDNVAAAYTRAIDHGAVPVAAPQEKPWGQTVSYVREINGFMVGINSEVKPAR